MSKFKDLTGQVFNRLTLIKPSRKEKGNVIWECQCVCGKITYASSARLKNGAVKSCGCLKIEKMTKHGLHKHPLNQKWRDMKDRCINENNKFYYRYGGRGLFVCNEWTNDFVTFYNWSVSNGWIQGLSIERRDNDRGYSPDNCYWATPKQQSRNTSRNVIFNNELAVDATKRLGGNSALIARRLHDGWTLEKAFTTPVGKYTRT